MSGNMEFKNLLISTVNSLIGTEGYFDMCRQAISPRLPKPLTCKTPLPKTPNERPISAQIPLTKP